MAFLPALPLGKADFVTTIAGDGTCSFSIDVPRETGDLPDLGNVTCASVDLAKLRSDAGISRHRRWCRILR